MSISCMRYAEDLSQSREEHVNPHEHSTFPDVACLPKTEKSGNHRLRSMIGEDTIVFYFYHTGILIDTAKEGNEEDGNFASRGGP
ncbi:hypothetical protein F2Q69_00019012 [Brassica cretica]|uniref:Uncharacterized protein n=1 Tax=Brassica cretica TaxID=69181 RepID=A0A8S9QHH9_BRACR|nr:hypothetical protein F2Q69_00019012 [Brassica cretica]